MPVLLRLLANPKLLARFMRTKAGRKAALKYGTMLVNSKTAQDSVKKFLNKNGRDRQFAASEKKYNELQAKIDALQTQVDARNATDAQLQTATFTLGRQVVEMQRLYAQLQQQLQQMQLAMAAARVR
ncbi:MAG: hypothetical protein K2L25_02570 [Alphaproteobacteria bacterium]|nr:hypothetical protein [Alphaproteobacteria bacterium]